MTDARALPALRGNLHTGPGWCSLLLRQMQNGCTARQGQREPGSRADCGLCSLWATIHCSAKKCKVLQPGLLTESVQGEAAGMETENVRAAA